MDFPVPYTMESKGLSGKIQRENRLFVSEVEQCDGSKGGTKRANRLVLERPHESYVSFVSHPELVRLPCWAGTYQLHGAR